MYCPLPNGEEISKIGEISLSHFNLVTPLLSIKNILKIGINVKQIMKKNKYLLYFLRDKVILVYSVDILFKY